MGLEHDKRRVLEHAFDLLKSIQDHDRRTGGRTSAEHMNRCDEVQREIRYVLSQMASPKQTNLHDPNCSLYDDGQCTCPYPPIKQDTSRSSVSPGEGTWAIFAEKMMQERDFAREKMAEMGNEINALQQRVALLEARPFLTVGPSTEPRRHPFYVDYSTSQTTPSE